MNHSVQVNTVVRRGADDAVPEELDAHARPAVRAALDAAAGSAGCLEGVTVLSAAAVGGLLKVAQRDSGLQLRNASPGVQRVRKTNCLPGWPAGDANAGGVP